MKVKLGIYASTHLEYAKPGNGATIEVHKIWDFDKQEVGTIKVDDYGGCRKLLEVIELEVDAEKYFGMKVDEFVLEAFRAKEAQLRAEFQKAITDNQAKLQEFLALPLTEQKDDDLPF